jgi:hypothetical protein
VTDDLRRPIIEEVATAVIGLVGAVIGGLLTGGGTYLLERRREQAEAKAARRIVRSQLLEATTAVEDALKGSNWPPGWHAVTWSQTWSTYRPFLAKTMDVDDFDKLAVAYVRVQQVQTGLALGKRAFEKNDEGFLTKTKPALSDARRLLDGSAKRRARVRLRRTR